MTTLKCSVQNCVHNSDQCCCKSAIIVDGSHAESKDNTCCGSFDEKRGENFKNSYESPNTSLRVECEAINCVYNTNRLCSADKIDISGMKASSAEATECSTFRMR